MIQRRPHAVLLMTPRGTVIIARRLFDLLEARLQPDDLGLLRDFEWWRLVSELVSGIEFPAPAEHWEAC